MFNIHPLIYLNLYFFTLLVIVLVTIYQLTRGNYNGSVDRTGAILFTIFILFFIGLRPYNVPGVGIYFGDTANYYRTFLQMADNISDLNYKDPGFSILTNFCARTMSGQYYFFILATLYILPVYFACRRLSRRYIFLILLMIATSFLFWSNGVNGIRIGIASSFFMLAFTFKNKKWAMLLLFLIALSFHKSILLPIGAFILSQYYKNSKVYILVWLVSIVLSLLLAGFWENFFASFDVGDERFDAYLTTEGDASQFKSVGFRWDFLLYSSIPVALGAYYIIKKQYQTKFYIQLFNTYLLANSFWILVMRANFSNRFASLSWFIIPIIIIFPLIKMKIWENQMLKISFILFLNFVFTFYMQYKSS